MLFPHTDVVESPVRVNIYADEVQAKRCYYTNDEWFYIGIVVELSNEQLLADLIHARYCGNFDRNSEYFKKNDRIIHWINVCDNDSKNICIRWLDYLLDPTRSGKSFHAYTLGVNNSKLNRSEFGNAQEFNRRYNRFFRTAVLYAIKCFFPSKHVIVENIYHEEGQQQKDEYFPWHTIYKLDQMETKLSFQCDRITFLPKCHRDCPRSNIIQLCDFFLGMCTSSLHGVLDSGNSKYKNPVLTKFLPLFQRMIETPQNNRSRYAHANRIMIRNFPREMTDLKDVKRLTNQFYTRRSIRFLEQHSGQGSLF